MDSKLDFLCLVVDFLGFSITINDHFQAGLGLDSVRMLRGFGVDLNGFAFFCSGCNRFSSSRNARAQVWAHSKWIGLEFESVHGEFDVDSNWTYCVLGVDWLELRITLNEHIQAGLGLDSGWILGGFGVDLRGFGSFFLDSLTLPPSLASVFDVFLPDPNLDLSAQVPIL